LPFAICLLSFSVLFGNTSGARGGGNRERKKRAGDPSLEITTFEIAKQRGKEVIDI
jgi:hypothetical protein